MYFVPAIAASAAVVSISTGVSAHKLPRGAGHVGNAGMNLSLPGELNGGPSPEFAPSASMDGSEPSNSRRASTTGLPKQKNPDPLSRGSAIISGGVAVLTSYQTVYVTPQLVSQQQEQSASKEETSTSHAGPKTVTVPAGTVYVPASVSSSSSYPQLSGYTLVTEDDYTGHVTLPSISTVISEETQATERVHTILSTEKQTIVATHSAEVTVLPGHNDEAFMHLMYECVVTASDGTVECPFSGPTPPSEYFLVDSQITSPLELQPMSASTIRGPESDVEKRASPRAMESGLVDSLAASLSSAYTSLVSATQNWPSGVRPFMAPTSTPNASRGCQNTPGGIYRLLLANTSDSTNSNAAKVVLRDAYDQVKVLISGTLVNGQRRIGGIAGANKQFQFDGPPQAGTVYTAGWWLCEGTSLLLGDQESFWSAANTDTTANIYTECPQGAICWTVHLHLEAIDSTASDSSSSISLFPSTWSTSQLETTPSATSPVAVSTSTSQVQPASSSLYPGCSRKREGKFSINAIEYDPAATQARGLRREDSTLSAEPAVLKDSIFEIDEDGLLRDYRGGYAIFDFTGNMYLDPGLSREQAKKNQTWSICEDGLLDRGYNNKQFWKCADDKLNTWISTGWAGTQCEFVHLTVGDASPIPTTTSTTPSDTATFNSLSGTGMSGSLQLSTTVPEPDSPTANAILSDSRSTTETFTSYEQTSSVPPQESVTMSIDEVTYTVPASDPEVTVNGVVYSATTDIFTVTVETGSYVRGNTQTVTIYETGTAVTGFPLATITSESLSSTFYHSFTYVGTEKRGLPDTSHGIKDRDALITSDGSAVPEEVYPVPTGSSNVAMPQKRDDRPNGGLGHDRPEDLVNLLTTISATIPAQIITVEADPDNTQEGTTITIPEIAMTVVDAPSKSSQSGAAVKRGESSDSTTSQDEVATTTTTTTSEKTELSSTSTTVSATTSTTSQDDAATTSTTSEKTEVSSTSTTAPATTSTTSQDGAATTSTTSGQTEVSSTSTTTSEQTEVPSTSTTAPATTSPTSCTYAACIAMSEPYTKCKHGSCSLSETLTTTTTMSSSSTIVEKRNMVTSYTRSFICDSPQGPGPCSFTAVPILESCTDARFCVLTQALSTFAESQTVAKRESESSLVPDSSVGKGATEDGDVSSFTSEVTVTTGWETVTTPDQLVADPTSVTSPPTETGEPTSASNESTSNSSPTTAASNVETSEAPPVQTVVATEIITTNVYTTVNLSTINPFVSKKGAIYTTRISPLASTVYEICEVGVTTGCWHSPHSNHSANGTYPPMTAFSATGISLKSSTITSTSHRTTSKLHTTVTPSASETSSVKGSSSVVVDVDGKKQMVGMTVAVGLLAGFFVYYL